MPNLTDEDIKSIIEAQKSVFPTKADLSMLKESLDQHSVILDAIIETLNKHTTVLDGMAKNMDNYHQEAVVNRTRLERMEEWIKQAASKIGVEYKA